MAVNLNKHREALLSACNDVCNEKTPTNWALFGYEKQSNDLMFIDKGDGGIEELGEELNSAKIMYAYCRVIDPNTGLPKFLFINWQGEGAPLTKKGSCASHVHEICNFFKGAHVTVNARSEDDVEPSFLMDRVAKSSSSQFNFKDRSDPQENTSPIGSVYKRIQPAKEIDPKEREKFWIKEQEEEKRRVQEEKKKAEQERSKREMELKEREIREARAREEKVIERSLSISKVREAEQNAENTARNVRMEKMQWERQLQDDAHEEVERRKRSESLRRERSQEAHRMISKSAINSAKAIFEQNTCAGQMSQVKTPPIKIPTKDEDDPFVFTSAITPQPPAVVPAPMKKEEPVAKTLSPYASQPTPPVCTSPISQLPPEEFNYTRNLLKDGLPPRQESEMENLEEEQNWDEPSLEEPPDVKDPLTEILAERGMTPQPQQQQPYQGSPQVITSAQGQGLRARALYDYQAADETEISFDPDDLITHIEQIDEGWWQGMGPDGCYGLFPANYVELIE